MPKARSEAVTAGPPGGTEAWGSDCAPANPTAKLQIHAANGIGKVSVFEEIVQFLAGRMPKETPPQAKLFERSNLIKKTHGL